MQHPHITPSQSLPNSSILPPRATNNSQNSHHLKELGIQKLKSSINYTKYLNQLRSIENLSGGISRVEILQSMRRKKSRNKFLYHSMDALEEYMEQNGRNHHEQQINGSQQIAEEIVTQNIIKISEIVDTYLQKGLPIPKVTIQQQNTKKMSNKTHIENIRNRYYDILEKKNNVEISGRKTNKDNKKIKYQKELRWGKEGVSLDISNKKLLQKINIVLKDYTNREKQDGKSNVKLRKNKNKQGRLGSVTKIDEDSLIFGGSQLSKEDKMDKDINEDKQNNTIKLQMSNQLVNSDKKKYRTAQNDLLLVFENYRRKQKFFGCNQKLMTEKRQQAIFTNQLMKVARKYDSLDIFSTLANGNKIEPQSGNRKQQVEIQQMKLVKDVPICGLRQIYRKSFEEIMRMDTQKL